MGEKDCHRHPAVAGQSGGGGGPSEVAVLRAPLPCTSLVDPFAVAVAAVVVILGSSFPYQGSGLMVGSYPFGGILGQEHRIVGIPS